MKEAYLETGLAQHALPQGLQVLQAMLQVGLPVPVVVLAQALQQILGTRIFELSSCESSMKRQQWLPHRPMFPRPRVPAELGCPSVGPKTSACCCSLHRYDYLKKNIPCLEKIPVRIYISYPLHVLVVRTFEDISESTD